jgi:hypothetical protein
MTKKRFSKLELNPTGYIFYQLWSVTKASQTLGVLHGTMTKSLMTEPQLTKSQQHNM